MATHSVYGALSMLEESLSTPVVIGEVDNGLDLDKDILLDTKEEFPQPVKDVLVYFDEEDQKRINEGGLELALELFEKRLAENAEIMNQCETVGVSRSLASEAAKIHPGFLTDKYPLASFSLESTRVNLKYTQEAMTGQQMAIIAAVIAGVLAILAKVFGGGGGGGGGSDSAHTPAAAKTEKRIEDVISTIEGIFDNIDNQTDTILQLIEAQRELSDKKAYADLVIDTYGKDSLEYSILVEAKAPATLAPIFEGKSSSHAKHFNTILESAIKPTEATSNVDVFKLLDGQTLNIFKFIIDFLKESKDLFTQLQEDMRTGDLNKVRESSGRIYDGILNFAGSLGFIADRLAVPELKDEFVHNATTDFGGTTSVKNLETIIHACQKLSSRCSEIRQGFSDYQSKYLNDSATISVDLSQDLMQKVVGNFESYKKDLDALYGHYGKSSVTVFELGGISLELNKAVSAITSSLKDNKNYTDLTNIADQAIEERKLVDSKLYYDILSKVGVLSCNVATLVASIGDKIVSTAVHSTNEYAKVTRAIEKIGVRTTKAARADNTTTA